MCVKKLGKPVPGPVKAWKMFYFSKGQKLTGLCYPRNYKVGQTYESKRGPGFQAFVRLADARRARHERMHPDKICILAVALYDARKGIIEGMDRQADGKPGWCAPKMKILPKSNV